MYQSRARLSLTLFALTLAGCQSQFPNTHAPVAPPVVVRESPTQAEPWVAPGETVKPIQVSPTPTQPLNVDDSLSVDSSLSSDELYEKARVLMEGTPSEENKQAAVVLLNQAAELGNAEAMRVLGLLKLREGPDQRALGVALLEQSATNSIRAMRQLGILYGNLSKPRLDDPEKALFYLKKASSLGDGEASFYLSRLLARAGRADESKRLVALAADQGFVKGAAKTQQTESERSENVMRSYELQRQAMKGDVESMYQYAQLLLSRKVQGSLIGYEHSADFEAYYWLKRAALMGDTASAARLTELSDVEAQLSKKGMTYQKLAHALTGGRS